MWTERGCVMFYSFALANAAKKKFSSDSPSWSSLAGSGKAFAGSGKASSAVSELPGRVVLRCLQAIMHLQGHACAGSGS